jgi:hypothetical protein
LAHPDFHVFDIFLTFLDLFLAFFSPKKGAKNGPKNPPKSYGKIPGFRAIEMYIFEPKIEGKKVIEK